MVSTYKTMIGILQVRFQSNNRLLGYFFHCLLQVPYVLALADQVLQDGRVELFA
jgi:hypothetical protein